MQGFLAALRKYAVFSGRARRSEYWFFVLFYTLIYIGLMVVDISVGSFSPGTEIGLLTGIFTLAMLLPSLSVSVRRLHDTDRSGWFLLIALIPLIGGIILLVFFCTDSQPGSNRFGPNPKEDVLA